MESVQNRVNGILIGCGKVGGFFDTLNVKSLNEVYSYAEAISRLPSLNLVACVDIDIDKANKIGDNYKITKRAKTIQELNDLTFSFVIVATPDETHFSITMQLLEMKNPPQLIIVEKPVCLDIKQYTQLVAEAKKVGSTIIVNHSRRFDMRFNTLRKQIQKCFLGDLYRVDFNTYGSWKKNGIHLIDTLVFLFEGKNLLESIDVSTKKIRLKGVKWTDINIQFGDQFVVNIHENPEKYYQLFDMDFRFSNGRICFQNFEQKLSIQKKEINALQESVLNEESINIVQNDKSNMMNLMYHVEEYFMTKDTLEKFSINRIQKTMEIYLTILKHYEN